MTAETAHRPRYLEDLRPGERWVSDPVTITAEDIVQFGRLYDPQPMHVDVEAARTGPFQGLIASGWHIAALAMRLSVQARSFGSTPIIGAGVDELRWQKAVRPGDVLTLERTFVDIQPPARPGGRGTVRSRMVMRNQDAEAVLEMTAIGKIPSRPVQGA